MAYRILITGSREWTDQDAIFDAIVRAARAALDFEIVVIHGAARGADTYAGEAASRLGFKVETYPADWDNFGRKAGFLRNARMVKLGADVCLAFILNESPGASGCAELARKAGIEVVSREIND